MKTIKLESEFQPFGSTDFNNLDDQIEMLKIQEQLNSMESISQPQQEETQIPVETSNLINKDADSSQRPTLVLDLAQIQEALKSTIQSENQTSSVKNKTTETLTQKSKSTETLSPNLTPEEIEIQKIQADLNKAMNS